MRFKALGPFLAILLLALSCASAEESKTTPAAEVNLETEQQQNLYAIGIALSVRVPYMDLTDEEKKLVQAGILDGLSGGEPRVDMPTIAPRLDGFVRERVAAASEKEKAAGAAWVAEMAAKEGARTLDSGLVYVELSAGDGPTPGPQDQVRLHYHGTLRDGRVFDSSVDRGEPAMFNTGGVIPCFAEGLQQMKVGGKSQLVCPSTIAYGENGSPPKIRPGAALMFEVELLEILPETQGTLTP